MSDATVPHYVSKCHKFMGKFRGKLVYTKRKCYFCGYEVVTKRMASVSRRFPQYDAGAHVVGCHIGQAVHHLHCPQALLLPQLY